MTMVPFLHGAVAMGCAIVAFFFLRFWHQSRDRLLMHFAAAFLLLSISYTLLGIIPVATEWRVYVFVVRLLAFCLILFAIFFLSMRTRFAVSSSRASQTVLTETRASANVVLSGI